MAHIKPILTKFRGISVLSLGLLLGCDGDTRSGASTGSGPGASGGAKSTTWSSATTNGSGATTNGSGATTNGSGATTNGSGATTNGSGATTNGSGATTNGSGATTSTSSGGTPGSISGTTTAAVDFGKVPKLGDIAPSVLPDGPAGTVTGVSSVMSASSPYTLVTVQYPAAWQCPADAVKTTLVETGTGGSPSDQVALTATTCAQLAALRRPSLVAESTAKLLANRNAIVRSKCNATFTSLCVDASGKSVGSNNCSVYYPSYAAGGAATSAMSGATPSVEQDSSANAGATEYSSTNTQVASVDEADYVKNDGQSIFVLAADGLHVIDAWPAAAAYEIAHVALPGEPRRLFLSDNRLVVYTRIQASGNGVGSANPSDQGCTYGYGCRFTSEGGHTLAIVYDVSAPATPRELMRYEMSGGFVAARRVGASVYTVIHDSGAPQIPGLDFSLQANSYEELDALFVARVAANTTLINSQSDSYFLPWVQRSAPDGATTLHSECSRALVAPNARGMSFVSLTAFDLTTLTDPTRTVVGSNPGYVYASAEALYLAVDQAPEPTTMTGYNSYGRNVTNSTIHKFALQGTETTYRGSIALTGHILNQFAMDERQGVMRVASTQGWVPSPDVVSYVTTIGESAGQLEQLGQIGGIAPSEDIRSVRFDDDRGYVVTFKKTDPLFVFDLADPANPRKLGELKIPGFSTYMHRLDRDHLLAVGFEADEQGSFAYFNGIQIQIFDVTDLTNPSLMFKHVIGTRGSGSEALTNHLAFNYFAPKKMLAVPITVCEGGGNGSYGDQLTFAGLMAFDISLQTGITEHGRLPFLDTTTLATGESCSKWWTDATSLVKRSIFMDDWIYGLSDAQLRVANLASMSEPAAIVAIE